MYKYYPWWIYDSSFLAPGWSKLQFVRWVLRIWMILVGLSEMPFSNTTQEVGWFLEEEALFRFEFKVVFLESLHHNLYDRELLSMSSKYKRQILPTTLRTTSPIKFWNMTGALVKPNGIWFNSKITIGDAKAVFSLSSSCTLTCQYMEVKASLQNDFFYLNTSRMLSFL